MKTLSLVLTLLATAISAKAAPHKFTAMDGSVNFLAVGKPSMLKIHGKAPGPKSNLALEKGNLTGTAEFSLESLDTGINLRNQHMKEKYLQTKEYPTATLSLTEANVGDTFASSLTVEGERPFKGNLKLHGTEKAVEGKFTGKDGKISAKFQLKISDFGIAVPSYLGITVTDTVDVTVDMALKKEGV
jgi:polyisoprenoid-binding protein YceI